MVFVERNVLDANAKTRIVVRTMPDILLFAPSIDKCHNVARDLRRIRYFIERKLLPPNQIETKGMDKRPLLKLRSNVFVGLSIGHRKYPFLNWSKATHDLKESMFTVYQEVVRLR